MKNQTTLFLFVLFLFSFGKNSVAQDCTLPQAQKLLHGNNISANILLGGDLFWDRSNASFNASTIPIIPIHTIYNTGFWIGGFTGLPNNPILKMAGSDYNNSSKFDFSAGPLSDVGTTNNLNCLLFDHLWEVFGSEIQQHIFDFNDDGVINNPISNIYAYPGIQNPHFESNNGFALPSFPQNLAPFWDNNSDGIYNPDDGDYPLPTAVHPDYFPDHMIWGVFNDAGANHTSTNGDAIRAEIQLTAWASTCTDNEILNNTIFTSHKIINRAQDPIDSTFAGIFIDFDLGCPTDDYMGSIPELNTFYAYNSDDDDGTNGGFCSGGINTFAQLPPVQAVTYLNQSMSSFGTTSPANGTISSPQQPADFYNLLTGSWTDGSAFTEGGDGYNSGGQPTSFLFNDNPNDPNGWSMSTENFQNGDFRTISSTSIGSLSSQQSTTIDMAYTFYRDAMLDNLETVNMVYENTPILQQMYDDNFENTCSSLILNNEDLIEYQIEIFPNPTTDILNIKMKNPKLAYFSVFDIYGKKVLEKMEVNQSEIQLSTSIFSQGIYFLRIEMEGKEFVQKFIKM